MKIEILDGIKDRFSDLKHDCEISISIINKVQSGEKGIEAIERWLPYIEEQLFYINTYIKQYKEVKE